jgi:hypothetical protein
MSDASSYVSSRGANSASRQRHSPSSNQSSSHFSQQQKHGSEHFSGSHRSGASSSGRGSGSSGSNPFRNGSRDNLPSFAECFDGFNKFDNIGEHNIAAMSPQQAWTAPPPSAIWSGGGGGHHSLSSQQGRLPSSSAYHSSTNRTPGGSSIYQRSSSPAHLSPPPASHHVPIASMFSPIQRATPHRQPSGTSTPHSKGTMPLVSAAADSPGRSLPQSLDAPQSRGEPQEQFSYRTLDLSEDDEAASDEIGTPPRVIEREVEEEDHDSPMTLQQQQNHHHGRNDGTPGRGDYDANPTAGLSTPNNRPPLHPAALSPIVAAGSPIYEGKGYRGTPPHEEPRNTPPGAHLFSPHSERASPYQGEHLNQPYSHQSSSERHRRNQAAPVINPTLLTPPRRARSFEELAAKHLYPLFGAFLRSLPPKQLEHFLVHDDAIFEGDDHSSPQQPHSHVETMAKYPYSNVYNTRTVSERVNAIVPPLDDLMDTPREAFGSSPYACRDFAYRRPLYSDSIGTSLRLRLSGW